MKNLDHELKIVKEGTIWRVSFKQGTTNKEVLLENIADLSIYIREWLEVCQE